MVLFLYAVSAAAALWATARFLRPLSPSVALLLALLPLAFTGTAVVTGRVYAPLDLPFTTEPLAALRQDHGLDDHRSVTRYDVAFQMIPWHQATRRALREGEWPSYNPFMLCGDVLAAAAQPAVYHPIHVLGYLLPLGPSLSLIAALTLLAAALSAFCFLREIDCRETAALVGAAGWTYSSFLLFWLGWPHTLTLAFFPLLLLAARRLARRPGRRSAGLLTVALVLVVLAGHPESAFHAVTVAAVYGLLELWVVGGRSWRLAIGAGLAAGVLAVLLCALYLLPVLEALPQTKEFHGRRLFFAHSTRSVPWPEAFARLRTAVVPFAYGVPWSEWIETPRFESQASSYVGSVLWAPALLGLWRSRWRWLMLAVVVAGVLAHAAAPGLIDVLARLPLFDIALNQRLAFVAGFTLAVLAALGAEAWASAPRSRSLAGLHAGVLLVLAVTIAALWPGLRSAGLSAEFLTARALLELLPPAAAAVLLLTVRSARVGLLGLLAILVVQRVAQSYPLNPTYPGSLFYPRVAELESLPSDGEPYRVVGHGASFTPNLATLYGLEDARGYQAMTNLRLYRTFPLWSSHDWRIAHNARVDDLSRPFLSFLNVRFALARSGVKPPAGWRLWTAGRGFAIYENLDVLPRAFVPERVRIGVPEEKMWNEMAATTDFSEVAWIEERGGDPRPTVRERRNGPGRVVVERRGPGLRLEVAMAGPGWVVVSQTAWEGWRATSAGRELPLHFANHAFLAFHLPAGDHRVDLAYRPRSAAVGRIVSLLTFAGWVLYGFGSRMARSRRPLAGTLAQSPTPSQRLQRAAGAAR